MFSSIYKKAIPHTYNKLRAQIFTLMIVLFTGIGFSASANDEGEACTQSNYDHDLAEANGHLPYLSTYNRLAHDVIRSSIKNGFIIGVEKFNNQNVEGNNTRRDVDKALYETYITSYSANNSKYPKVTQIRNFALGKFKSDPKWPVVSHIIEYKNYEKSKVLNPYKKANGDFETGKINRSLEINRSLKQGLDALHGAFLDRLRSRIKSGNYTHIFFISMGWNNDQGVALCRYKTLMAETEKAMRVLNKPFKPLVVGFTWPSVWLTTHKLWLVRKLGHLASVFNKANDADEVGVLHGNLILNRLIPKANVKNLPVVVIGHSYGARLAGRAIFSRSLLKQGALGNGPDLALLLQPAYSAQRHMIGKGLEGYPFAQIENLNTAFFVTSSKKDKANPIAIWSRHFGGFLGLRKAYKDQTTFRVINKGSGLKDTLRDLPGSKAGVPNVIDATGFITNHNEIYSDKVGTLLAALLVEYTY